MAHVSQLTIRFNKEVAAFQHLRLEATLNLRKDDDRDVEVSAVKDWLAEKADELTLRFYGVPRRGQTNYQPPDIEPPPFSPADVVENQG